jgi:FixJ family two-component response regulator
MLRRVLRLAEYEVATFESGQEFLASLAARMPACVILDVHMPRLSGLDVQAQLQAMHRDVPVVFITASDDPILDKIVQEARGVTLLRKPFRSDDLLDVVSAILQPKSCSGD